MSEKVSLDLTGVGENIFSIFAAFREQALRQGWSKQEVGRVVNLAKKGNYRQALATILEHCVVVQTEDSQGSLSDLSSP